VPDQLAADAGAAADAIAAGQDPVPLAVTYGASLGTAGRTGSGGNAHQIPNVVIPPFPACTGFVRPREFTERP
jgi:hypothetical protein